MTTLTIIPDYDKKRLKCVGRIAAGEHVDVSVLGAWQWAGTGNSLRLRFLFGRKTMAIFPYWTEAHEEDGTTVPADAWSQDVESLDDATCVLNLNTVPMQKLRFGGTCLVVLDDAENHTLYGTCELEISSWPKRRGEDVPYSLDEYPDIVGELRERIEAAEAEVASQTQRAVDAETAIRSAVAEGTGIVDSAKGFRDEAESAKTDAVSAKEAAESAAEDLEDAVNAAKGHADDAKDAKDVAVAAKNAAEAALPLNIALDTTGKAADAKAVGDAINAEKTRAMGIEAGLRTDVDAKASASALTNLANIVESEKADKSEVELVALALSNLIGNDEDRTVRDVAADEVAKIVNNAPESFDTLKEIADWIAQDPSRLASLTSRILELENGKVDKVSGKQLSTEDYSSAEKTKLAAIAEGAKDNVVEAASSSAFPATGETGKIYVAKDTNKTYRWSGTLYVEVGGGGSSVDVVPPSTDASASGKAADAKATGDALAGKRGLYDLGYARNWRVRTTVQAGQAIYTLKPWPEDPMQPAWRWDRASAEAEPDFKWFTLELHNNVWTFTIKYGDDSGATVQWQGDINTAEMQFSVSEYEQLDRDYTVQRSSANSDSLALVSDVPTKTSQLTNDGAPNGGGTPYATTAQVAAKQDALSAAQLANIAAVPYKANATDLPYAMVTPGEWEFSGTEDWFSVTGIVYYDGLGIWQLSVAGNDWGNDFGSVGSATDTSVEFIVTEVVEPYRSATVVATKTGIHLLDRAGNHVVVSGDTTLTLPSLEHAGRLRDFLVRLEISGSTVPTITFQGQGSEAPDGADEIIYETDGDEFPVPDEAGTWLYAFTETAAHTFAVSLKKVNVVAQGGS